MERASNPYKPGTSSHRIIALHIECVPYWSIAVMTGKSENNVRQVIWQWRHRSSYLDYQRNKYPLRSNQNETHTNTSRD